MKINEFVSILLHSRTQSHVFHLLTKSYSEHKAMKRYYKNIDELIDNFIETYQGRSSNRITSYRSYSLLNNPDNIRDYFNTLSKIVKKMKVSGNDLNNIKDEIEALINQVLYLLTLRSC